MFYYIHKLDDSVREKMLDYMERIDVRGFIFKDTRGYLYIRLSNKL